MFNGCEYRFLLPAQLHQLAQPVLEAALCDRRLKLLRQLPQGQLRVGLPQDDGLLQLGGEPRQTARGGCQVTYFKSSVQIEQLLALMGAPRSAGALESARAEKRLRNGVNRQVNCESANLDKMVAAAQEQRRARWCCRRKGTRPAEMRSGSSPPPAGRS